MSSEAESAGEGEQDRSVILAHFQEITGVEDEARCVQILSAHHWNLEASVQDLLNEKEGISPVFSQPAPPPAPPTDPLQPPRPPPPRLPGTMVVREQTWWEWLVGAAMFPLRFVLSTANELLQLLVHLLFGLQPSPARNPQADVQQFITAFEASYGPTHPTFLNCSYSQALAQARRELRFLLVYLHSPGHQDTPRFCREVLATQEFTDFAVSHCLVWGVGVNSQEGVRVSYVLRENTYPFLALVVLKGGRMVVVERVEGWVGREELQGRLQHALRANEAELVVERTERARRDVDKRLREEQDKAFEDSLRADQEKERRKVEDQRRVEQEAELRKRKEEEFATERALRVGRLPPEPEPGDPDSLHVMLRLPSGGRMERRFTGKDKLQSVYDFAFTSDGLPGQFTLVTNFPRQELLCSSDGGPLLQELGLGRKCVLFVQDNSEE